MSTLMGHFVLGYPSLERSIEIALEYAANGVTYLECQFPFSDPSADGPVISKANIAACKYSNDELFSALKQISEQTDKEIVMMSYITRIHKIGYELFFDTCKSFGITNYILPDIPYDEAVRTGLLKTMSSKECNLIPVISRNTSFERIKMMDSFNFPFYYLMSYYGTTGKDFDANQKLITFITNLKEVTQKKFGIGFGVKSKNQINDICKIADFAIMGSELLKYADSSEDMISFLKTLLIEE